MTESAHDAYLADWDAAVQRQRTDALHLEALAWDVSAALHGNPVACVAIERYGRERILRRIIATAMQQQPRKRTM
jgi:hypothetical protein